ncbi:MAG: response regulator [Flavobacteriaceae bacterium]
MLLGGLGITTLTGIFLFFLYRNRQKTNRRLKELDTAKSNFFTNISHEFRTPLTLISAPIEKKLENEHLSAEDRQDFEMVRRNATRLLNLVDQLLDLAKLESGNVSLKVRNGNINLLLQSIAASFEHKAATQSISYHISIAAPEKAWYDADVLEKIVVNLVSNAFKYVTPKGQVRFAAESRNERIVIQIENDGEIFGNTSLEEVFNRFFQKEEHREGVGVGLALVKELVSLYHGTITVKNTAQSTVLFEVILPCSQKDFSETEINFDAEKPKTTAAPSIENDLEIFDSEEALVEEETPILLIIEDNNDIRAFMKSLFIKEYRVLEAADGEEGIVKALETVPDIIISDIMMPKITGLALCETLKKDERTSHIPIILLTAKAEEEAQYQGLETGADDYIVKPFNSKLLDTKVRNMVASRKHLRERYSQEVILKPKNIAISRIDEQFIEKVQRTMDAHLMNPDFSAEDFSAQVGMSRMQLHRKLKALTGLTTSELIRNERLKMAAVLLKESDIQISEVCYQVGFNNPSYFAKCFKETYGCLPSEYSHK